MEARIPVAWIQSGIEVTQKFDIADAQSGPVLACYVKLQEKHPGFEGRVTMIVSVDAAGKVEVMPSAEGPGEKSFITCVAARVSAWKFPKPYPKFDDSFIMGLDFAP